ncbi:hypothetical protein [Rudaeicoccus suwonensis]|uniref:D-mannose binding lectin n=1 Tax=Rudaeicoccus suwonensis TaxID=657409 RepID=A0A561E7S9_9MICO|nr:hypothetical protein [Rudaeicoccus suwonensis]TWE11673.1 D-mannose binding lectin [Rudaeicoccus suwonensis]
MRISRRSLKLKALMSATAVATALSVAALASPTASAETGTTGASSYVRSAAEHHRLSAAAKAFDGGIPQAPASLTACNNIKSSAQIPLLVSTNESYAFVVTPGAAMVLQDLRLPNAADYGDLALPTWVVFNGSTSWEDDTMLALYCNGDLAVRAQSGALIWHSNTAGKGGKKVTISNSGNIVMTNAAGAVVWQSGSRAEALTANHILPSNQFLQFWAYGVGEGTQQTRLSMYTNGDLAFSVNGKVVWHSKTKVPGSHAALTTRGQLMVISPAGKLQWSSKNGGGSLNTAFDTSSGTIFVADDDGTPIWQVPGTNLGEVG